MDEEDDSAVTATAFATRRVQFMYTLPPSVVSGPALLRPCQMRGGTYLSFVQHDALTPRNGAAHGRTAQGSQGPMVSHATDAKAVGREPSGDHSVISTGIP